MVEDYLPLINEVNGEERNTHCERAGRIAGHCPTPTAVERRALFEEDADDAPPSERLRVDLPLDF